MAERWQEKMVEVFCVKASELSDRMYPWSQYPESEKEKIRQVVAESMREALPLIEVTPGMADAGVRDHPYEQSYAGAEATLQAMLTACSKEGRDV